MYVPPYHNQQPMAKLRSPSGIIMMFFIFCQIYILPITQATAQLPFLSYFCENDRGNYTRNSTYHANLNHILSTFPSRNDNGYGFYSLSYGNSSDQVHLIGLCRGDANPNICSGCLNNATQLLPEICPNQKEAVGWHDYCMLRYSNRSMLGIMETYQKLYLWNDLNVSSNVDEFFRDLQTLLDGLKNRAASGGSLRKFATGNASGPDFQTLYALVQCTPDLSHQDCNNCLDDAFADIPECCDGKIGGRVIGTNCNFRYEIRLFYNLTDDAPLVSAPPPLAPTVYPPSPPSTSQNTSTGGRKESNASRRNVIIDVVSSSVGAVVLITSICAFLKVRRVKQNVKTRPLYEDEEIESVESLQYSFETIRVATDNFTDANKLGQGGFGFVYRGRLSNGQDIAVKRLSKDSGQGDLEFKNEVLLVAKLQHRNLVKLLGFCLKENERLLVYEFVRNASLDHFIFDPSKRANLNWDTRHKIIGGIARGLLYLHEDSRLRIIHRDLKASNILLDEEMQPKISDFGMARLFVVDQTQDSTSRIVGTYGYMAPEYALHGHFSVKIDVFSFGVLLLEIVSGQKNNCFRNGEHVEGILSYAWRNWRDKTASNVIDPLMRVNSSSETMRCIHIALLCVQENVALRPTMNAVVLMLNSYSLSLPLPSKPAFSMHSNTGSDMPLTSNFNSRVTESDHSKSQSVQASTSETLITELHPR